jgi:hypothetical protein
VVAEPVAVVALRFRWKWRCRWSRWWHGLSLWHKQPHNDGQY